MEIQKPTFMLLPDTDFPPGKDLLLGTLLPADRTNKHPDPRRPVNQDTRVPVSEEQIRRQKVTSWSYDTSKSSSKGIGLWAELPMIPFLSTGGSGIRQYSDALQIQCDEVDLEVFMPSDAYFAKALDSADLRNYASTIRRKPLYMITGLMKASDVTFSTRKAVQRGFGVDLAVDGTAVGAPVRVGPELSSEQSTGQISTKTVTEPFILAYQLRRIRLKRQGGGFEQQIEDKWALFNEHEEMLDTVGQDLSSWSIRPVNEYCDLDNDSD